MTFPPSISMLPYLQCSAQPSFPLVIRLLQPLTLCHRRVPPLELVAAAVTARSALDCADLERLETLGDAYLKFAVSACRDMVAGGAGCLAGWKNGTALGPSLPCPATTPQAAVS